MLLLNVHMSNFETDGLQQQKTILGAAPVSLGQETGALVHTGLPGLIYKEMIEFLRFLGFSFWISFFIDPFYSPFTNMFPVDLWSQTPCLVCTDENKMCPHYSAHPIMRNKSTEWAS